MTPEMSAKLKRSVVFHEGYRKFPYVDSVGKTTIGIGYNLSDRGLPDSWINQQYDEDSNYFYQQLTQTFPWFLKLTDDRQIVLIDMCFMGFKHFCSFKKMIAALEIQDYENAAKEMLDSKWANQVKTRAIRLANAMITGVYDI